MRDCLQHARAINVPPALAVGCDLKSTSYQQLGYANSHVAHGQNADLCGVAAVGRHFDRGL
jgi:hypothetical protein